MARPVSWADVITMDPSRGPRRPAGAGIGQRPSLLSARNARRRAGRRGGGGGRDERSTTPEGVIQDLMDQGMSDDEIAQIVEGDNQDDGFSVTSPSDWFGAVKDLGGAALDKLDVPRAYFVSGLAETADAIGAGLEKAGITEYIEPEATDRFRQTGISWQDFVENAQNRVGGTDILEADPRTEGWKENNPALATAAGIGFDILSDPTNYLGVGLADDPLKVARSFQSQNAIRALGEQGAREAAQRVVQRGVNSLSADELAAIGQRGGLQFKTPGTGMIGRATGVDRALSAMTRGAVPRRVPIAARGSLVGDVAAAGARTARRPVNRALRGLAPLQRSLGGQLGALKGTARTSDDADEVWNALWAITLRPEARGVASALGRELGTEADDLIRSLRDEGVDLSDVGRAVAGDVGKLDELGPQAQRVRDFLARSRTLAGERAGAEVVSDAGPEYLPRFLTDEALESMGLRSQAGGTIESIARRRALRPGETFTFGKKSIDLVEPSADSLGRSIEDQVADFVAENGGTDLFRRDLSEILPQYLNRLSRQTEREYLGRGLVERGVGKPLVEAVTDEDALRRIQAEEDAAQRTPRTPDGGHRLTNVRAAGASDRAVAKLDSNLSRAEDVVRQAAEAIDSGPTGPRSADAFDSLYDKARRQEVDVDFKRVLDSSLRQYGRHSQLPENIVEALTHAGRMAEPGGMNLVLKIHDKLLTAWRQMALLTPGYHWRNSFGATYMNWLAGMDEGRYWQLERLIAHDATPQRELWFGRGARATTRRKGGGRAAVRKLNDPQLEEAYEAAKRMGVFRGGQTATDVDISQGGRLRAANPFRFSHGVSSSIENRVRGALFIDEYVKNGGDATEAFAKMQKYHFDYEDLSEFERNKMRRIVPFYTWTRKSIPLMMEMVVRNPGKINRYFTAKRNIEQLSEEEGIFPEYFEDNWAIRLPWTSEGGQLYMMPDLPMHGLADVADLDQMIGNTSPFLKLPYEYASGQQIWKGVPIEDGPAPIPNPLAAIPGAPEALRALGLAREDAEGNLMMSERHAHVLLNAVPFIGQARRLFPTEDKYEDRRMSSWISYLLGTGLRTNTEAEQATELWRRYYTYGNEMRDLEDWGFTPDTAQAMAYDAPNADALARVEQQLRGSGLEHIDGEWQRP